MMKHAAKIGQDHCAIMLAGVLALSVALGTPLEARADDAAAKAFIQWRFKPGILPHPHVTSIHLNPPLAESEGLIKVPISYTMVGMNMGARGPLSTPH